MQKEGKNTYRSVQDFVKKTRQLLKQQQQAEIALFQEMTKNKTIAQIQSDGVGLSNMVILAARSGFYGRQIITLAKSFSSEKNPIALPQHCKLQTGDDVAIYNNNAIIGQGVIHKRTATKLKISLMGQSQQHISLEGKSVSIVMKWNQVTFRRYMKILQKLQNQENHPLLKIFFESFPIKVTESKPYENPNLNSQQCDAVQKSLSQECHLIHGPPGTGKTKTICQLIVEAVSRGQRVLACAPSNIAVDNIVQNIAKKVNCVRIGNPARMIDTVLERCLDFLITKNTNLWKNQVKKLHTLQKHLSKCNTKQQKKSLYKQIRALKTEIHTLQEQTMQEILLDADVLCCTNAGAGDKVFNKYITKKRANFDLVVIDQCGQGLQVSCWIPLLKGKKAVLAGDHKQLPPTVKSLSQSLLSYTLFSRAMEQLKNIGSTMLRIQYRMNQKIMGWSNKMFYQDMLEAHQSVKNHQLKHLYHKIQDRQEVLLMIDTQGCRMGEEGESDESKMNKGQADIAVSIYKKLLSYGVQSKYIAILTPYSKQVSLIRHGIQAQQLPNVEVSTVDGIQGREKQCIIISLVRSNPKKTIGFLKDWRRMNVAVTRARRMLILIGDSECVSKDPILQTLIKYVDQYGHRKSAIQMRDDRNIRFGQGKVDFQKPAGTKKQSKKKKQNKGNNQLKQKRQKKQQQKQKKIKTNNSNKEHTSQQENTLKVQYRQQLANLQKKKVYKHLSAFHRKMLHEVAEQLGYKHQTSQNKQSISIWVPQYQQVAQTQQFKQIGDINHFIEQSSSEQQQIKKQYRKQTESDLEQQYKEQQKKQIEQLKEEESKPKKKKQKKKNKQPVEQTQQEIDKILEELKKQLPKKDQCYKCHKKLSSVTAIMCKFCHYYFCRFDLLAQEHGCGDEAARQARQNRSQINLHIKQGAQKIRQKVKEQQQQRKKKKKK